MSYTKAYLREFGHEMHCDWCTGVGCAHCAFNPNHPDYERNDGDY